MRIDKGYFTSDLSSAVGWFVGQVGEVGEVGACVETMSAIGRDRGLDRARTAGFKSLQSWFDSFGIYCYAFCLNCGICHLRG